MPKCSKNCAKWLAITMVVAVMTVPASPKARASSADRVPVENSSVDPSDEVLSQIKTQIQQLLATPEPELYRRHLQSVLALCEDGVLKAQFAGPDRPEQEKEMLGYLKAIETGLEQKDARQPDTYLVEGRRSLNIARLSQSDGTLQLYTVSLPAHWSANKAYPLWVQLHGRWSDLPLALVASSLAPYEKDQKPNEDSIILTPWVRGNSDYRLKYGSEPDIWEAINDLKTFAKLDPDRWYISGHSWGGDDTWAIVLRTPDLWAAAGIMAGHPHSAPKELGLVSNARYVPFYLWRGDHDQTPNREWAFNYFRDSLTAVGDPPKAVVAPGVPHMYRPEDLATMQIWLFEHVRHRPNHFSFVIDTPDHRGVWGISIPTKYELAYFNVDPRASFECWIEGPVVRIQTTDSNHLDVDLGPQGLNMSGQVKVVANGKKLFDGTVPAKPLSLAW
jgi:pimeloyl-ACP methyl ester carboxylesterase